MRMLWASLSGFDGISMRYFLYECPQGFNGILKGFYKDLIGVLKDFKWMLKGVCQVSRRIPKGILKGFL